MAGKAPTRAQVELLYLEFNGEEDLIVAALLEDFPYLTLDSALHDVPMVELLLDDLWSYSHVGGK